VALASQLSAREHEVAAYVAAGRSNREIAEALSLSERTVEHHVRSIFTKLQVKSRVEVANVLRGPSARSGTPSAREDLPATNLPSTTSSFIGR